MGTHFTYRICVAAGDTVRVVKRGPGGEELGEPTGKLGYTEHRRDQIRRGHLAAVRGDLPEDEVRALGEALFNVLFDDELRTDFLGVRDRSPALLRVELDINEAERPELAALPWEFLCLPAEARRGELWLGTAPDVVLVRRRALWSAPDPVRLAPGERLRVAVVVSNPRGSAGPVKYESVLKELRKFNGDGRVELIESTGTVTTKDIDAVLEHKPHVFHFIGHSRLKDSDGNDVGQVALVEEVLLEADWIDGQRFAELFTRHRPAVVLLQACEGAAMSPSDAFVGVASRVVQQNVPVVVAMQYEVSNASAGDFAQAFYKRLLAGEPVDKATQEARRSLANARGYKKRDFATPVLFLRAQGGRAFEPPVLPDPTGRPEARLLAPAEPALPITQPRLARYLLDRWFPTLHAFLTRLGNLTEPPELEDLRKHLRRLRSEMDQEIKKKKVYLPLTGLREPGGTGEGGADAEPAAPLMAVIRHIQGPAHGGDAVGAPAAGANRRSRFVRNIITTLLRATRPLVLLGDPGSGKTMTLQHVALTLAEEEVRRVFPVVTVYVRLGEFHAPHPVTQEDVLAYVKAAVPPTVRCRLDALCYAKRLVVLFDGMDEMSRERYNEHTEALSLFAGANRDQARTLFSCRRTDFSPKFVHERLILQPFDRAQIAEYLRSDPTLTFPIAINGEQFSARKLAGRLWLGNLTIEATNPFVLWLLCFYLHLKKVWPTSRVDLLRYYLEETYRRKAEEAREGEELPDPVAAFREWGRYPYAITLRNSGSAIPLSELPVDPPSARAGLDFVSVGLLCGVFRVLDTDAGELVRFEHHRLQEYFTARHVRDTRPGIAWLDKIDAPRWQETMVNLVLLGGADEAVGALTDSIAELLRRHREHLAARARGKAPEPDGPEENPPSNAGDHPTGPLEGTGVTEETFDDDELLLSDRVELASRIVHQMPAGASPMRDRLAPGLREAIEHLAEWGNPITQVKVMRACQNVPEADLIGTVRAPLKSPVDWVRTQALIMIAESPTSARAMGADLATEVGYDLANGAFVTRLPAYLKAARAAHRPGAWWCLLVAGACWSAHMLVLLTAAGLLYLAATVAVPWLAHPAWATAYTVVLLVAMGIALRENPHMLWEALFGSAAGSLVLTGFIVALWSQPSVRLLVTLLYGIFVAVILAKPVGIGIAVAAHFGSLAAYRVLTRRSRDVAHTSTPIFSLAWQRGYQDAMREWRESFGGALGFVAATMLLGAVAVGLRWVWDKWVAVEGLFVINFLDRWVRNVLDLPYSPFLNIVLALSGLLGVLGAIVLVVALVIQALIGRAAAKPAVKVGAILVYVPLGILTLIGAFATATYLWRLLPEIGIGAVIVRVVVVLAVAISAGTLGVSLWRLLRALARSTLGSGKPYPPNLFTPAEWQSMIASANAEQQKEILTRSNYQSVGLTPDEFLDLLKRIRDSITAEPALSTYWEVRNELQQVLKQEKLD